MNSKVKTATFTKERKEEARSGGRAEDKMDSGDKLELMGLGNG